MNISDIEKKVESSERIELKLSIDCEKYIEISEIISFLQYLDNTYRLLILSYNSKTGDVTRPVHELRSWDKSLDIEVKNSFYGYKKLLESKGELKRIREIGSLYMAEFNSSIVKLEGDDSGLGMNHLIIDKEDLYFNRHYGFIKEPIRKV